ncbi:MAG: beta-L-arabinofuranosidase domain-containing protein [Capsulimonas sp.]|uniref:beta-L-arabinofuranosidase domain-containing protein n=1 Tax=Capsulimonas sp. TaxID=2494211 RepID=UPI0032657FEA
MKSNSLSGHQPILAPRAFEPLPLGAITPGGWLRDQLRVQAAGLTGTLDEFWPSVANSRWIGGDNDGWERGPYWLDGLIPLAILLQDERLLGKARRWVDYILNHQHEDGWLGPKSDPNVETGEVVLDPWPQFVLFKALTQWQEATGNERVIPAMLAACHRIAELLDGRPLRSWGRMRWADLVLSAHWLYDRTAEVWLLELAAVAHQQGYDWQSHFADFQYTNKTEWPKSGPIVHEMWLPLHGVNNAMGVKSGAVWSRQSGDTANAREAIQAIETLDRYHGQVHGAFSCDEHLAGRDPAQGAETCMVTEYLFTLEQMLAITGEASLGDRIERIAYNALPAAMTKDMTGRQYDQQANQVLCSVAPRDWTSNDPYSNLFSLEGHFGCCTANLHQGWPKLVASLWMRSLDGGLVAAVYAPSSVTAEIDGVAVTIEEATEYPFRGHIQFTVRAARPTAFPLRLRIPAWAASATVRVNDGAEREAVPGKFHLLDRVWSDGDVVSLRLPLEARVERRSEHAVSVLRGPLVMALKVDGEFRQVSGEIPYADWEVHPTTPWNYALQLDASCPAFSIQESAISSTPFTDQTPPVTLSAGAVQLPGWGLTNDSAAPPPEIALKDLGSDAIITLVPYGSTYLRISEFPCFSIGSDA